MSGLWKRNDVAELVCPDLYFSPPRIHRQMFKCAAAVYYHIWVIRTFTVNCEEGNDGTRNNRETTEQSRNNGTTPEHQISGDKRVRILQELDLVDFWSWNLHVVYMCLHGLVFVVIVKTKKSLIICQLCC